MNWLVIHPYRILHPVVKDGQYGQWSLEEAKQNGGASNALSGQMADHALGDAARCEQAKFRVCSLVASRVPVPRNEYVAVFFGHRRNGIGWRHRMGHTRLEKDLLGMPGDVGLGFQHNAFRGPEHGLAEERLARVAH